MRQGPARIEPYYSRRLVSLTIDESAAEDNDAHPVTAKLERIDPGHQGEIETVRARYVVGTDGARSTVRRSIGRALSGDSANQAWGVMDVLAVTDFPDIRFKTALIALPSGIDPAEFQRAFVKAGRFTAGTAVHYGPSLITAEPTHQHLARGLEIGTRFHSAPVIRYWDAKCVHLGHTIKADGRWSGSSTFQGSIDWGRRTPRNPSSRRRGAKASNSMPRR